MRNRIGIIAGIAVIFVASWIAGSKLQQQDAMPFKTMSVVSCQPIGTTCTAEFHDAILQLEFSPSVVVMSPFLASVSTQADIEDVFLEFRMNNMDMGMQRYRLLKNENGVWQSEITLPVCSLGRSDWTAVLEVQYRSTWWRGEFGFEAAAR